MSAFEAIARPERLADRVVAAILESIRAGTFAPGDPLPSERALADQFGVSRTVIREAVRTLAARGLLDVRGGSGVRVARVEPSVVEESLQLFLWSSTLEYGKVHEVRELLEVRAAALAAERATAPDVAALDAALADQRGAADVEAAAAADVEFHRVVARATHNDLILVLHDAIGSALSAVRHALLARGPDVRATTLEAHQRIRDAIAQGDGAAAAAAMRDHLATVEALHDAPG